jgi:hypothetical protein
MFSVPVMRAVWRRELRSRLHTVRITGLAPESIWGGAGNLAVIGIRFPDRQARGKSDVFCSRTF